MKAELFGHEKGAFTGALGAKAGWFEEANGGTFMRTPVAPNSVPAVAAPFAQPSRQSAP